jgi:trigger factor
VKVTQEESAQRQVVLNIEVEPQDLEPYLQRAYRQLSQRLDVPGFRKGKAPRSMVERLVGHETFLHEALHAAVPDMTDRAVTEQGLEISSMPDVEIVETDPLVILKATVPLTPEVELADYRSLRMDLAPVEMDEGAVDEAVEELRRESSPWEPVDRPLQVDDLVVMDLSGSVDGQYVLNQTAASYVVSLEPFPAAGFGEALVGMKLDETREFTLTFPDDETISENVKGKPCDFVVTAKESKERHLPELDDEFAKGVGNGFDSLEALREDIRQRLGESKQRDAVRAHEADVVERVLKDSHVELPPLLIQREVDHLLEEMQESSGQRQADVDAYVASLGKSEEEVRAELHPRAVERLERAAVLSKIAEREQVAVSQEALEEEAEAMVVVSGAQSDQMQRFLAEPRNRDAVGWNLRTRLTVQRLGEIARGIVEPGGAEGQEAPEGQEQEAASASQENDQA